MVKTLGREPQETERFQAAANELRDAQVRVGQVRGMFDPVLEALPNLGVLAVLLVGATRVEAGDINAGRAGAGGVPVHPAGVPGAGDRLGAGRAAPHRSSAGTGCRTCSRRPAGSPYGAVDLVDVDAPASLDVRRVDFAYDDAPVLHDVSFSVDAGRTIAVVGPTGSGKSTLTTLLVRLVDPASGEVVLDGIDLRAVARGGVAGAAAVVPQQTFLFDDTVRGNVTLGLDLPDSEVRRALVVAQADRFVDALPDGLDTRIGERGMTLSGGQRQRLALARAIVRSPRLLVMDDATSSVDARVEAAILAGLRSTGGAAGAPTVVVVAYRKATISLADEVVYVEHGRVVDRGTHLELLGAVPGLPVAHHRVRAGGRRAGSPRRRRRGVRAGRLTLAWRRAAGAKDGATAVRSATAAVGVA